MKGKNVPLHHFKWCHVIWYVVMSCDVTECTSIRWVFICHMIRCTVLMHPASPPPPPCSFTQCPHTNFLLTSHPFYQCRKLNDLLDALEFNQVVIFVSKVNRAMQLNKILEVCTYVCTCVLVTVVMHFKYTVDASLRIWICPSISSAGAACASVDIDNYQCIIVYGMECTYPGRRHRHTFPPLHYTHIRTHSRTHIRTYSLPLIPLLIYSLAHSLTQTLTFTFNLVDIVHQECNFPSIVIHAGLKQEERIARFKSFKVPISLPHLHLTQSDFIV